MPFPATLAAIRRRLLAWFSKNARELPWRGTRDPYLIWISEIMLQQTQVATVVGYFGRFKGAFPSVRHLAAAEESEVLRLWEGLGYYRRARQMHAAAKQIVERHEGRFPRAFDDVVSLPGIGRYTAGAILSIAHGDRYPVLEANTLRLLSRLLGYRDDPRKAAGQRLLWEFAKALLPGGTGDTPAPPTGDAPALPDAGQINQALMELGSLICAPRNPACDRCPLVKHCPTFANGWQEKIPLAAKKVAFESLREAALLVRHRGRILMRKCQPGERWAGLWDFPRFALEAEHPAAAANELAARLQAAAGLNVAVGERLTAMKHGVTRYRIELACYAAELVAANGASVKCPPPYRWIPPSQIESLPLSATGRKLANGLLKKVK